jgi:hypothetical protein
MLLKVILILFLLARFASADVGIGLSWNTESGVVREGMRHCMTDNYRIYNPFDTDVMGYLQASGNLSPIASPEEPKLVPAGTYADKAIPTEICFDIPKVYREKCHLGIFLCEQECKEEKVVFDGHISAMYVLKGPAGTGSAVGSSVAAPLELSVVCEPHGIDWGTPRNAPFYLTIVALLICLSLLVKHFF